MGIKITERDCEVPGYISVSKAARLWGVSARVVHNWIESGHLRGTKKAFPKVVLIPIDSFNSFERPKIGRPSEKQRQTA